MELRKMYEAFNGDYDSVIKRLRDEERIKSFLVKFMDNKLDVLIMNALREEDYETAFREAHNLKGICANLNLDALCQSASNLTESLRGRDPVEDISPLVDTMLKDYYRTVDILSELKVTQ